MLIVNPNCKNPSPMAAIEPPIWCALLAGSLQSPLPLPYDAPGNTILDAELEGLSIDETVERIGLEPCVLVAMGANPSASSTPKMDVVNELRKRIPGAYMAGLHPAALRGRRIFKIPSPAKLKYLSPVIEIEDYSQYRAHNWHCLHDLNDRGNYAVIYTSFGCPFDCSYCNIHSLYKTRKVEFKRPAVVVEDIAYLVYYRGVRNIKIADELFVLNEEHVNAICDGLIERNYNLNMWAYARVDMVNPPLLEKMKKAGIDWLCYGFEAGDDSVLEGAGKNQTIEQMFAAAEMTHQAGINILGNFMFGLPDDNMRSMRATLDMAKELKCEWVNMYAAMAYPGSKLYEDTPKEHLPEKWADYGQYSRNSKPLPTKHLTSEEVLWFKDNAFREYFTNPDYQSMIRNKFGQQAVDHIKEMLEWRPRAKETHSLTPSLK
ncbi:hypothetical protein LCGC14_1012920 [marine sediment metagenome]|uniref:Radical SAM core domain-containing protein n=1 Tax=marine sediment metagenome TaxID=412755 RepID=A0A0F9R5W0_9ZZZZ